MNHIIYSMLKNLNAARFFSSIGFLVDCGHEEINKFRIPKRCFGDGESPYPNGDGEGYGLRNGTGCGNGEDYNYGSFNSGDGNHNAYYLVFENSNA